MTELFIENCVRWALTHSLVYHDERTMAELLEDAVRELPVPSVQ